MTPPRPLILTPLMLKAVLEVARERQRLFAGQLVEMQAVVTELESLRRAIARVRELGVPMSPELAREADAIMAFDPEVEFSAEKLADVYALQRDLAAVQQQQQQSGVTDVSLN